MTSAVDFTGVAAFPALLRRGVAEADEKVRGRFCTVAAPALNYRALVQGVFLSLWSAGQIEESNFANVSTYLALR